MSQSINPKISMLFAVSFIIVHLAAAEPTIHLKGNTFTPEESQAPEKKIGTNSLQKKDPTRRIHAAAVPKTSQKTIQKRPQPERSKIHLLYT